MNRKTKIFLLTLGCPKNTVDAETILKKLSTTTDKTQNPKDADIILINTCSFLKSATEESIDAILEATKYKKKSKNKKIIVSGCLAGRYEIAELKKSLPEVDLFVKPYETDKILKFLKIKEQTTNEIYDSFSKLTPKHRTYVKIADGCCNNCTYCMIPTIRGKYKSKPEKEIINEVKKLFESGVKEITLVAQDTTSYGVDVGSKTNIISLLKKLSPLVNEKKWIRILYSQPKPILYDVADFILSHEGFTPYLDVPIQHISKKILELMNRNLQTEKIIRKLKQKNIFLRTTVMTGFPHETKKDFNELLSFIKEIKFDHLGAFVFSPEEGTKAYKMSNKVSKKMSEERLDLIMNSQATISQQKLKSMIGQKIQVLVEGKNDCGEVFGRHMGQAPEIDGTAIITKNTQKSGEIINCEVLNIYTDYDLLVKPLL